MRQNKLFKTTRWQLASWYAGIMGGILCLFGFGVYEAIVHAHRVTVERELRSVSATIHNSLESTLVEPGKIDLEEVRFLPNLCLVQKPCFTQSNHTSHALANAIVQDDYYLSLMDNSGKLIAYGGAFPHNLSTISVEQKWLALKDKQNKDYQQTSLLLHTKDNQVWGYLLVGRSLQQTNKYLASVRLILLLGLPLTMIVVAIASRWLAKLAMEPIYQSYKQIQQFTADAAHELRTPLAAIRATVESTQRVAPLEEAEVQETLKVIARQNSRLVELVEGLLLLSRADQQELLSLSNQKCNPIYLNDLVNDLTEELASLARRVKVELRAEIGVSRIVRVRGNEEQLYRLVANLVTNGINHTPSGGKVTVILEVANSLGKAVIRIKDTGVGIAPEQQEEIFKRFYRIGCDRSRKTGGFGLGLPIALAIAEAHQGSIEVQSYLGEGSTFSVYLPLA